MREQSLIVIEKNFLLFPRSDLSIFSVSLHFQSFLSHRECRNSEYKKRGERRDQTPSSNEPPFPTPMNFQMNFSLSIPVKVASSWFYEGRRELLIPFRALDLLSYITLRDHVISISVSPLPSVHPLTYSSKIHAFGTFWKVKGLEVLIMESPPTTSHQSAQLRIKSSYLYS